MWPSIPIQPLWHVKMCRTWVLLRWLSCALSFSLSLSVCVTKTMKKKVFCLRKIFVICRFFYHQVESKMKREIWNGWNRIALGKYLCELLLLLIISRLAISYVCILYCVAIVFCFHQLLYMWCLSSVTDTHTPSVCYINFIVYMVFYGEKHWENWLPMKNWNSQVVEPWREHLRPIANTEIKRPKTCVMLAYSSSILLVIYLIL